MKACVNPQHLEDVTRAENVRRGSLSKLTAEIVRQIRADSTATYAELGERFGVNPKYIGMVKNSRRWKDVR